MNKSKILRAVLTVVLTLVATTASALSFEVDGIKYNDNGDGTVSVTSNGYTGDVEIPSSVTYSETPYSVTSIGNSAFKDCSGLTSVTIPNSVTSIGRDAFNSCSGLISVTIPNSVNSIDDYAFYYCSGLTSVIIGNSVTSIGEYAFSGCSGLESIEVESDNSKYDSREKCNAIIETATNTLLAGCKNTTIPNSVTSIGDNAFNGCSGLTSITIPNSVNSIGKFAFSNCSGLKSVTIPNSVNSIGNSAFQGCSGMTSVTIPNSVNSIGDWAFNSCKRLTSVTIPNSIISIGNYAFSYCSGLTSVTIPNSVNSIGDNAFNGCSGLKSVTIPNSVNSIGNSAFYKCSELTSVTIGNSVTSIGEYAFYNCSGLTSVISKAVTPPTCGSNAFLKETYSAHLIVPSIAKEAYKTASTWSNFSNYAETDNKITAIAINNNEANLVIGNTLQLSATVSPEDATFADVLQWSSSNPDVATVDDEGLVTTLALGKTVITATSCDGSNISATCNVVVCAKADNVNELVDGYNIVGFAVQGVKMHNGVLYACTTAESVNKSYPTLHGNNPDNMDTYEDHNLADFNQRDWVAISGLEGDFEGKELSYPFVAQFADGVLTPSGTITTTAATTAYKLNTFRAENILHGGYSNYAEGKYKAYYVPARVNEVANFMGHIETVGEVKYLYSNNDYGRKDGEGIKIENCTIADNSKSYSLLEGILVADASTKAGVKIIMLKDLGAATGVEGVDTAAARIYTADGNIIIAATEDGEAAVYDFTGRLIKSVPVASGDSTAVPVTPGYYIVKTGTKTQSVVVK